MLFALNLSCNGGLLCRERSCKGETITIMGEVALDAGAGAAFDENLRNRQALANKQQVGGKETWQALTRTSRQRLEGESADDTITPCLLRTA
jgi:hypothetical protein